MKERTTLFVIAMAIVFFVYYKRFYPEIGTVYHLFQGGVYFVFLLFSLLGEEKLFPTIRKKIFYGNILMVMLVYSVVFVLAPELWWVLNEYVRINPQFFLTETFSKIPYNNGGGFITSPVVLSVLHVVYSTGYFLPIVIPVLKHFSTARFPLMWRYFLAVHPIQLVMLLPLYFFFQADEIWFFYEKADPLNRMFSSHTELLNTVACSFPSMHTSVAVATAIVALDDPDKKFRNVWVSYNLLVVLSTFLLPIHWIIDVLVGALVGACSATIAKRVVEYADLIPLSERKLVPVDKN